MHPSPIRESITLNGLDLSLYAFSAASRRAGGQPAGQDQETNVVQLSGEPVDVSEEPVVLDTFHLGFGYSWRLMDGTYAWAENADCRFPRLAMPGPHMTVTSLPSGLGSPRCGQDYAGDFYFGVGNQVWRVPNGTGTPVVSTTLTSGLVVWSMDTFLGNLYVGTSTGNTSSSVPGPLQRNAAGVWTGGGPNRKAIAHAWYQAQASGTFGAWQLLGSDSPSSVSNVAADPMVPANWGAAISVGDTTYGINSLVSNQGHIYVAKVNGLHDVDGSTGFTPNLMPFYEAAIDDDNGVAAICANGNIYVNDIAGLFRMDVSGTSASGSIATVTPGHGLPNETPIRGKITAMTSYGPWVIAAVYNGTDTFIMWGRDIRQGDTAPTAMGFFISPEAYTPSPMLWHGALIYLPGQICRMLAISGLTSPPRLWLGTSNPTTGATTVQSCVIPRTENPMQDVECTFAQDWTINVPGQDWTHPVTTKDLLEIDIQADGLGPSASIDFHVSADSNPPVLFGTAADSPQSNVVGADDLFGRRLAVSMSGHSPQTEPAAIRAVTLRSQLRPALRRVRTYDVLLAEGNFDRFGGRSIGRPLTDYQQLEPLQWGGRVTLRDEFSENWQVLVLPPISRRVIYLRGESGKGTGEPVIVATLQLKLLGGDTTPAVTRPVVYWDAPGVAWDTDDYWSAP